MRSTQRRIVALVVGIVVAGCGQAPDAVVSTTPTTAPDEATVATMVEPSTTHTTPPATTTTALTPATTTTPAPATTTESESAVEHGTHPKPHGEPTIVFPTWEREATDAELVDADTGFVSFSGWTSIGPVSLFEATTGYRSYRVTHRSEISIDGETTVRTLDGIVDGTWWYYETSDNRTGDTSTILFTPFQGTWHWDSGEWRRLDEAADTMLMWWALPDTQQEILAPSLDSLTFIDWDLIDGVWYARYEPGRGFNDDDNVTAVRGNFWLSPDGFVHSYDIVYIYQDPDREKRVSWALSELGTAAIDLPDELRVEEGAAVALRDILVANTWTTETFVGNEPLTWYERTAIATTGGDGSNTAGSKEVLVSWGEVDHGDDHQQHSYVANEESRDAREEIVMGEARWRRTGALVGEQEFAPDGTAWSATTISPDEPVGIDEHLAEAQRLFGDRSALDFEYMGNTMLEGVVPADTYRATVQIRGELGSEVDAVLQVMIDPSSDSVRILALFYEVTVVADVESTDGGTESRQTIFVLWEVGTATVNIEPPPP